MLNEFRLADAWGYFSLWAHMFFFFSQVYFGAEKKKRLEIKIQEAGSI